MSFDFKAVNHNWTLFLDRDGVINVERKGEYINTWQDFVFQDGVLDAMPVFASRFRHIFVVTNQRGVSKGITNEVDLALIHRNMLASIQEAGGRIDQIYFCTAMEPDHPFRKPNPGMGLKAKLDFTSVDFSQSIMIGNKLSDMEFGRNLGCKTIFLPTTNPEISSTDPGIDAVFNSLLDVANELNKY